MEDFLFAVEIMVFPLSAVACVFFLIKWYRPVLKLWPPQKTKFVKTVFGFLPLLSFAWILTTLLLWASFDVVGSPFYIIYYIFLGFA
ncbi:MAG: hypothetical protein FWE62_05735 [Firmicutes bacterium]|nr:hypothetical protein [Bacillota bacterium]